MKKDLDADVIVIGGGPAGMSLTALLAKNDVRTICLDREDPKKTLQSGFDGRTTAISYGSQKIMDDAGVWENLAPDACPIKDIQIMDAGSPVLLEFLAQDVDKKAFGWIVENYKLRAALYARLAALKEARHIAPMGVTGFSVHDNGADVHLADGKTLSAKLIVGADGRESFTRESLNIGTRRWSYQQQAIACVVTHEHPHEHMAVEHFRAEGPFAILPMRDDDKGRHRSSIVWTQHGDKKKSAMNYDEETFNVALNALFPESYGEVRLAGKRFAHPLGFVHAHAYTGPRLALVADAAHGIHPIAGQGLNIGLRDISVLARLIGEAKKQKNDVGTPELLETYERQRRPDNMAMAAATDALNRLFGKKFPPLRLARKMGLRAVQNIGPARRFFMRRAMGI